MLTCESEVFVLHFLYSQSCNQVISNPGVVVATLEFGSRHFLQHKARKGAGGKFLLHRAGPPKLVWQFSSVTGNVLCGNNTYAYPFLSRMYIKSCPVIQDKPI